MSRTTRRLRCNECVHVENQFGENYLCVKKGMWVWPWLVGLEDELSDCDDFQSSASSDKK